MEQVLFHDVEMLKHRTLSLGDVMLLDGLEDLLVPATRKFMTPGAHRLHFFVAKKFPVKRQAKKKRAARFVHLGESRVVRCLCQRVMIPPTRISRRGVMRKIG